MEQTLTIANHTFHSRLFMGTSGYPDQQTMIDALEAGETEMSTVCIRRINVMQNPQNGLLSTLKNMNLRILPNTAGCYTAKEAVLTAQLAREALETNWIKIEIMGDDKTLYPDVMELLKAAQELVDDGFIVLPYCNDDLVTCCKLQDIGCAAIMPLGSPIGSGMGILNPYNLELIREKIHIPLILDAGIGTASDVVRAMELGCDAVLVNTAIAQAQNPVMMATSMKQACQSGRNAYLSGRIPTKHFATASSSMEDLICR